MPDLNGAAFQVMAPIVSEPVIGEAHSHPNLVCLTDTSELIDRDRLVRSPS